MGVKLTAGGPQNGWALEKVVPGPFKNGVILGINSFDFWGVFLAFGDGAPSPKSSKLQVESAEDLARTLVKKRTLNWFVRG